VDLCKDTPLVAWPNKSMQPNQGQRPRAELLTSVEGQGPKKAQVDLCK